MIRRAQAALLFVAVTVPAPVLVASCGDGTSSWSDADRAFVAQLIPHHHLGMTLTDLAAQRSADVRLRRLVFEMSGYHRGELGVLEDWARSRNITGSTSFPGDIAASEIDELEGSTGSDFDRYWLDVMIRHHEGALDIAAAQLASGTVAEASELAHAVTRVQSAELETMERLLGDLCSGVDGSGSIDHCGDGASRPQA